MKVKLLRHLAQHQAGAIVDYHAGIAEWLITHGHATEADTRSHTPKADAPASTDSGRTAEQQAGIEPARSAPSSDEPKPVAYDPPPRAGRGSTTAAWRTYATKHGVTIPTDADRDDIITACRNADIPVD